LIDAQYSRVSDRSTVDPAIKKLVQAIALLARPGEAIYKLGDSRATTAAEHNRPKYDVTSRSAGYDAVLICSAADVQSVETVARYLEAKGLHIFLDREPPGSSSIDAISQAIGNSKACVIMVGADTDSYSWRNEYLRQLIEQKQIALGIRIVPVLLPGSGLPPSEVIPMFLAGVQWVRLESLDKVDELIVALQPDRGRASAVSERMQGSPYKGLAAYDEMDGAIFVGREVLIERMLRNLEDTRFLVAVGPSGVGKTSVIRAGVIPALRRGAILGSERWQFLHMSPRDNPLRALLQGLAKLEPDNSAVLEMASVTTDLGPFFGRLEKRIVLVIDSFEGLFTQGGTSRSDQDQFIQVLMDIVAGWKAKVALIIVMRSDFIADLLRHSIAWSNLVESNLTFVGPLNADELRRAIEVPAQRAGLAIEPGLPDLILSDSAGSAGVLPLLQYVLDSLWKNNRHGYLTVDAYRMMDGIAGAVARDAESFYGQLQAGERETAMAVLLRLVEITSDGKFVRRSATLEDLRFKESSEDIRKLLDRLIVARLVVSSEKESQPKYELAHEAIVNGWPRFRKQIENEVQWLLLRNRLTDAASRWHSSKKGSAFLYPEEEILLLQAPGALPVHKDYLSVTETEFIGASEVALARKKRRLLLVALSMAVLAICAVAAAILAFQQRSVALVEATTSDRTTHFMVSLFQLADPAENRGNAITVKEVLDRGAQEISRGYGLRGEPRVRSELLTTMGQAYTGLGLYSRAEEVLSEALQAQTVGGVPADPRVRTFVAIGLARYLGGNYKQARPPLQKAVEIARKDLPAGDELRSQALTTYADLLVQLGEYPEAEGLCMEALLADRKRGPEGASVLAKSLSSLGTAYFYQDNLMAAEAPLRESLVLRETSLGMQHPLTAESMSKLGALLYQTGRFDEATTVYLQALPIYREVFGPEHPEVATILNNLGRSELTAGRINDAEPLLRQSLAMSEKFLGPTHDDLVAPLNSLAMIDAYRGRLDEALQEVSRAEQIARLPDHGYLLDQVLLNKADIELSLGKPTVATPLLAESRELLQKSYPFVPNNEWRYAVWDSVNAQLLAAQSQLIKADQSMVEAQKVIDKRFGKNGFYSLAARRRAEVVRHLAESPRSH